MAAEQAFKAVINDTNPASGGRAFGIEITGSNYNHFLGKKIGDSVDGTVSYTHLTLPTSDLV